MQVEERSASVIIQRLSRGLSCVARVLRSSRSSLCKSCLISGIEFSAIRFSPKSSVLDYASEFSMRSKSQPTKRAPVVQVHVAKRRIHDEGPRLVPLDLKFESSPAHGIL